MADNDDTLDGEVSNLSLLSNSNSHLTEQVDVERKVAHDPNW